MPVEKRGDMRLSDEIFGLNIFTNDRPWYFADDKIRRKASLVLPDKSSPSLSISVPVSDVPKFEKSFDVITTSTSNSRLSLFSANGYGLFLFPGSKNQTVNFSPGYLIHQQFSKSKINFETDNIVGDIPGINLWFGDDLLDFDEDDRSFKNKQNIEFTVNIPGVLRVKLEIDFRRVYSSSSIFSAEHASYARMDFEQPTNYVLAIIYFKAFEVF